MSRIFTSTILFNKSINSGGAAFMEEKRSQDNNETSAASETTEATKTDFDAKALFDSYMNEFQEKIQTKSDSPSTGDKWSPLKSFHAYLDALEKEPDLYRLVSDGIKELRERVHFEENELKDYDNEDFSLTAYDICLKKSEHYPENTYSASSKFDILYILLNWMQEAGVRGDCSYNDAYPLTVIQNEDTSYIWSVMIFKDGTLKECTIGDGRDNEEASINYRSIEDIQIEIADKPFQFSNYNSINEIVKSSTKENSGMVSLEDVIKNAVEARANNDDNQNFQETNFAPLSAEAINFMDNVVEEKGLNSEWTYEDVWDELFDPLMWEFGLFEDCDSESEKEELRTAIDKYIRHKCGPFSEE